MNWPKAAVEIIYGRNGLDKCSFFFPLPSAAQADTGVVQGSEFTSHGRPGAQPAMGKPWIMGNGKWEMAQVQKV